jgi:hypothetical protein
MIAFVFIYKRPSNGKPKIFIGDLVFLGRLTGDYHIPQFPWQYFLGCQVALGKGIFSTF